MKGATVHALVRLCVLGLLGAALWHETDAATALAAVAFTWLMMPEVVH